MAFSLFFGLTKQVALFDSLLPSPSPSRLGRAVMPLRFAILAGLVAVPLVLPSRSGALLDTAPDAPLLAADAARWLGVMKPPSIRWPAAYGMRCHPSSISGGRPW